MIIKPRDFVQLVQLVPLPDRPQSLVDYARLCRSCARDALIPGCTRIYSVCGGLDDSITYCKLALHMYSQKVYRIQQPRRLCRVPLPTLSPPITTFLHENAITFLISAIAFPGFNPLGQVLEQFRMVWHRYKLIELSSAAFLSSLC